jgi:hypothetical protein
MERKTITGRIHGYHWLPGVTYGNGQVIIQDDESGMFWAYTADRETVRAAAKLRSVLVTADVTVDGDHAVVLSIAAATP